jgi:hypothetical protein
VWFVISGPVHQKADWDSIHAKICQLLIPLRTTMPFYNSEEERQHGLQQLQRRQASPIARNGEGRALVLMLPVPVPVTGSFPRFHWTPTGLVCLGGHKTEWYKQQTFIFSILLETESLSLRLLPPLSFHPSLCSPTLPPLSSPSRVHLRVHRYAWVAGGC